MSVRDPNDVHVYGEALLTDGLAVRHGVSGYGLLTRGFLWQLYDIFIDTEAAVTTSWSDTETSLTTTWTDILTPS